ncbi:podoplanin domain-containing [Pyrenophora seminiperda CCB06]|uniref:Podoplanin domain-containing n=1 Tax=Pyrenophora seminiperda CCB06 TaxID=1302712 RepID=A0A3M7LZ06_9PLEO|nr:podoplanin domain-containing [Pyrenophora seminiperda CCB06]
MPTTTLTWVRVAALAALATHGAAQQCFYPNGAKAPDTEKPCSSAKAGSACCPDKWECLDNGLCHYPANNLYGRYSCTDKSWKSDGCASNMCTYGMTVSGGESITQCSNHGNQWCCNGDAQHVNCCQESPSPRPFFALGDGSAYATIGGQIAMKAPDLASITGLASGSAGGGSTPQTSAPASSNTPSSAAADSSAPTATVDSVSTSATPFISVSSSVSSGTAGVVTIPVTFYVTPSPTANSTDAGAKSSSGGSDSNLGLIIGLAVGIPLALAMLGIIFWLLRKRRQQKANPYNDVVEADGDNGGLIGGAAGQHGKKEIFRNSAGTAEIDGNPVGAGRPISTVKGHAELPSGNGFQPGQGTPYGPNAVGIGGGNGHLERNTWGSVPPQYSPAHNQTAFNQYPEGASELDGTSAMPIIDEEAEGPQQYLPYKPPQPVAEMPTITTPPEEVEKQVQR